MVDREFLKLQGNSLIASYLVGSFWKDIFILFKNMLIHALILFVFFKLTTNRLTIDSSSLAELVSFLDKNTFTLSFWTVWLACSLALSLSSFTCSKFTKRDRFKSSIYSTCFLILLWLGVAVVYKASLFLIGFYILTIFLSGYYGYKLSFYRRGKSKN